MRVVVCGSRDFDDAAVVNSVLFGLAVNHSRPTGGDFIIIEGVCPFGGADALAADAATFYGWRHEQFPPENREGWDRPTSYEFLARNRAMIDSGADLCVAFVNKPLASSKGTAYTVDYARSKGVKTIVVECR